MQLSLINTKMMLKIPKKKCMTNTGYKGQIQGGGNGQTENKDT